MTILSRLSLLACVLSSMVPHLSAASVTYLVSANTSSLSGQNGYLDLQLEPGPSPTNLSTASVTHFTSNGTLGGSAILTGDAIGQLPGTVSLDNKTVFNDYFQPMTFGTSESFEVTLNGPAPTGGGPSSFNIAFYASDQSTPLLTDSADGDAGQIVVNADGSTTPSTSPSAVGAQPALTISVVQPVTTIPEPSQWKLFSLLFITLIFLRAHTKSLPTARR